MALTKIDTTVMDIDSVSNALSLDTVSTGIRTYLDNALAQKANVNNAILTGMVSVPSIAIGSDNTQAANVVFVSMNLFSKSYGLATKPSGLKIFVSSAQPAGNVNDIWLRIA